MARPLRLRREFNPDRKDHPLGEAKAEAGPLKTRHGITSSIAGFDQEFGVRGDVARTPSLIIRHDREKAVYSLPRPQ
jgi:hypothetical protein